MGKTVIFGGTFNPVHCGHVQMAAAVAARPEVEELLILPARLPVHKFVGRALAQPEDRMQMCRLAFADIPKIRFSDFELRSREKNYSITTVRALQAAEKEKQFAFLIGGDSLIQFHTWHEYRALLRAVPLYVFGRGSCAPAEFAAAFKRLRGQGGEITLLAEEIPGISSSEIRERCKNGLPLEGYVPAAVAAYIRQRGLYLEENGFDG